MTPTRGIAALKVKSYKIALEHKVPEEAAQLFLLERYKYILKQKQDLNERTFKISAVYQATIVLVCSAQYKILLDIQKADISYENGKSFSWACFAILCTASAYYLALIIGGLLAWLKYRRDEASIEEKVFGSGRAAPSVRDFMRWYESYLLTAAIAAPIGYLILLSEIFPNVAFG